MKPAQPDNPYMLKMIARIYNDFPTKFGLPRQSGMIDSLRSEIVFEPHYQDFSALSGLAEYSHLWLLWGFSEFWNNGEAWSPTVRPPRLGGNKRMGVFATRSPNRPNAIGLSSVRLIDCIPPQFTDGKGPVLHVSGADIMSGTPIFDIKPYLPYTDSHPDAKESFTEKHPNRLLAVDFSHPNFTLIPPQLRETLIAALANDPRPAYQHDPSRVYGFLFDQFNVRFTVQGDVLTVYDVQRVAPAAE